MKIFYNHLMNKSQSRYLEAFITMNKNDLPL